MWGIIRCGGWIRFPALDHFFNSASGPTPRRVTREQLDRTKRYLHQLRTTRGYDLDCNPDTNLVYCGLSPENYSKLWLFFEDRLIIGVIPVINSQTGKDYQLVEIYKAVSSTAGYVNLLTFAAKERGCDHSETFLATIDLKPSIPTNPPPRNLRVVAQAVCPCSDSISSRCGSEASLHIQTRN